MPSFIKTPDHLTVVFDDGDVETVYPSNPHYDDIISALNNKDWDTIRMLANPVEAVKRTFENNDEHTDRVRIEHGVVFYDGKPLHTYLTERMIALLNEGIDINPLIRFLENVMENPSYRSVQELYTFLEASDLPITEDGCFLAYKRIREDWMDQWTGSVDNSIGSIVEIPRNQVDDDSSHTCSSGLHFCSRSYLPHYGSMNGGRVVIVKINPRDVVAIPEDYNNAKGRTCRYEVISEIELDSNEPNAMPKETLEGYIRFTNSPNDAHPNRGRRVIIRQDPDTGEVVGVYDTPRQAAISSRTDSSNIRKVLNGQRKTAGGWIWRYDYD